MSVTFERFKELESTYASYIAHVEQLVNRLRPFSEQLGDDFTRISHSQNNFKIRINDFYQTDRKLRICIIGQIKAGKSSFLNTLLFNGDSILPEASTPKTANLTIMEYGEQNHLEIEFYSIKEWQDLERLSKIDTNTQEVQVAKETMQMVRDRKLDPYEFVGQHPKPLNFNEYKELLGKLNDYAGDNGKYTPVVKSLTLFIANEKVKNIYVVDTPGMNDPIASRTDKTRQSMEITDVVFYLSMAEKFLDKEDIDLLIRQLPEKGAKRIIVVASKYDSVIIDDSMNRDSLEEVEQNLQTRLPARAQKVFKEKIAELERRNPNTNVRKVLEESLPPLLVSARAHNLATKPQESLSIKERNAWNELNELWDGFIFSKEDLLRIGNMQAVHEKLDLVIAEKEQILFEKSRDFIPDSINELTGLLKDSEYRFEKRIQLLEQDNLQGIKEQQQVILQKKHAIMADTEALLGGINVKVEQKKLEVLTEARRMMREFMTLPERTGTETKRMTYEVSTAKVFKPWTWFSKETKSESYSETYQYLDLSDAIANVRHYADEVSISIERIFSELVQVEELRRSLTAIIVEHFDAESESFDPGYFRLLVEKSMSTIEFPFIQLNLSNHLQTLTEGLTGEVREANEKSTLLTRLSTSIANIFEILERELLQKATDFRERITGIKEELIETLLADIQKEIDFLETAMMNKTQEIETYKKLAMMIKEEQENLQIWR